MKQKYKKQLELLRKVQIERNKLSLIQSVLGDLYSQLDEAGYNVDRLNMIDSGMDSCEYDDRLVAKMDELRDLIEVVEE